MSIDPKKIKQDFPIFQNYPNLVYLDSAATSQKPQKVIDMVTNFYKTTNSNIHRGIYHLAEAATTAYEDTREVVSQFINAKSAKEIIFTINTNYAINIVALGWAKKYLKHGDIVVISEMEHHANLVPWLKLNEELDLELVFLPVNNDGRLEYKQINIDFQKIKLLALSHASNVLGTINPITEIVKYFKHQNPKIKILIDAAQSIPHIWVDVINLDCDFLAFSSHKMLGPSGVGVLWAKEELLEDMDPYLVGSHMIRTVTKEEATWADIPDKFEPGTGNLEGVVGLSAAINYLQTIGMEKIMEYEQELTEYALEKLNSLPYLELYGPKTIEDRLGIFSFGMKNVHPHDIAQVLDSHNVAVRSGHHCCQVLMRRLNVPATARASLYLYNTMEDIDKLVKALEEVKQTFKLA